LCNRPAERVGLDVVRETAPPIDLHDRQPLPVLGLEGRVAGDVDLAQIEAELLPQGSHLRERLLAQVAALGVEDGDARDRCPA
jgi:hypothetical protein